MDKVLEDAPLEEEGTTKKIIFTDRRLIVMIGRTIKTSESKFEFSKFTLGEEATIPDDVSRQKALDVLFKELMAESILRETAIRAATGDPTIIDKMVILLRTMLDKTTKDV